MVNHRAQISTLRKMRAALKNLLTVLPVCASINALTDRANTIVRCASMVTGSVLRGWAPAHPLGDTAFMKELADNIGNAGQ